MEHQICNIFVGYNNNKYSWVHCNSISAVDHAIADGVVRYSNDGLRMDSSGGFKVGPGRASALPDLSGALLFRYSIIYTIELQTIHYEIAITHNTEEQQTKQQQRIRSKNSLNREDWPYKCHCKATPVMLYVGVVSAHTCENMAKQSKLWSFLQTPQTSHSADHDEPSSVSSFSRDENFLNEKVG